MSNGVRADAPFQALIPGAYERNTLTHRQPGAMGGPAFGSANTPVGPSSLAAETIAERQKEGGGGATQRPHRSEVPAAGGSSPRVEQNRSRLLRGSSWLHTLLHPR